jgi:hypothetical protein
MQISKPPAQQNMGTPEGDIDSPSISTLSLHQFSTEYFKTQVWFTCVTVRQLNSTELDGLVELNCIGSGGVNLAQCVVEGSATDSVAETQTLNVTLIVSGLTDCSVRSVVSAAGFQHSLCEGCSQFLPAFRSLAALSMNIQHHRLLPLRLYTACMAAGFDEDKLAVL